MVAASERSQPFSKILRRIVIPEQADRLAVEF